MSVRSHSEHDEVEDGESGRILLSELRDQLRFVFIGNFFELVLREAGGDGFVDLVGGRPLEQLLEKVVIDVVDGFDLGDIVKELALACEIVAVWVVEGYDALIGEVDVPT